MLVTVGLAVGNSKLKNCWHCLTISVLLVLSSFKRKHLKVARIEQHFMFRFVSRACPVVHRQGCWNDGQRKLKDWNLTVWKITDKVPRSGKWGTGKRL